MSPLLPVEASLPMPVPVPVPVPVPLPLPHSPPHHFLRSLTLLSSPPLLPPSSTSSLPSSSTSSPPPSAPPSMRPPSPPSLPLVLPPLPRVARGSPPWQSGWYQHRHADMMRVDTQGRDAPASSLCTAASSSRPRVVVECPGTCTRATERQPVQPSCPAHLLSAAASCPPSDVGGLEAPPGRRVALPSAQSSSPLLAGDRGQGRLHSL